jgi:DNA-binding transcriptional MerR regulator
MNASHGLKASNRGPASRLLHVAIDKTRTADRSSARRLRAIDLAREAGISTQQVRNYVDAGILPPVARSPSGYRMFGAEHARALTVARELARGHGWPRARAIMRAVHRDRLDEALAVIDHSHAELHGERTLLTEVLAAFDTLAAGLSSSTPSPRLEGSVTIGEAARRVGVRRSALRVWETQGLLRPGRDERTRYRAYAARDLRDARIVVLLRQGGYRHAAIRSVLDELRTSGDPQRVRAALSRRETEVAERSRSRLSASSALHHYLTSSHP